MNRQMNAYIRTKLLQSAIHPLWCITGIICTVAAAAAYFIIGRFFSGSGTTDLHSFFQVIPVLCSIVIPALSVKSEYASFDDFLPLSDLERSISDWFVTLVKFSVLLIPLAAVPGCVSWFGDVDFGQCAACFLMLFLYGSSACALCTACGRFPMQRVLIFLVSAFMLAFFCFAQAITPVLSGISFSHHFESAEKGIVDLRDIIFYLAVTVSFLALSVRIEQIKRGLHLSQYEKRSYLLLCCIIMLSVFDSQYFYFRADWTRTKRFTLSSYTRNSIVRAEDPLRVTYYRTKNLSREYPGVSSVADYLALYCGTAKNMPLEIKDPDSPQVQTALARYGIEGQQIKKEGINKTEFETVYSAIVMEYRGNTAVIPFILSADTLEYDLDSKISLLLNEKRRTVSIMTGNGLSVADDYHYVVPWLTAQGIACNILDQSSPEFSRTLAQSSDPLIIFGSSHLNQMQVAAIEQFVLNGGHALFAVSPYEVNVSGDWTVTAPADDSLIALLKTWGFSFSRALAADISCASVTMMSSQDANGIETDRTHREQLNYPYWISVLPQKRTAQGITLFWPSPIERAGTGILPVLVSSPQGTAVPESGSDPLFDTNPFTAGKIFEKQTKKETIILAAEKKGAVEGIYTPETGRQTYIIVIGDQYCADSLALEYNGGEYGDYRNLEFLTNCVLRLCNEPELADIQNRAPLVTALYKITDENEFKNAAIRTGSIICLVIPFFFAGSFTAVSISRKRKKGTEGI